MWPVSVGLDIFWCGDNLWLLHRGRGLPGRFVSFADFHLLVTVGSGNCWFRCRLPLPRVPKKQGKMVTPNLKQATPNSKDIGVVLGGFCCKERNISRLLRVAAGKSRQIGLGMCDSCVANIPVYHSMRKLVFWNPRAPNSYSLFWKNRYVGLLVRQCVGISFLGRMYESIGIDKLNKKDNNMW